jgi:DNA-binding SARP family transcriptional activator
VTVGGRLATLVLGAERRHLGGYIRRVVGSTIGGVEVLRVSPSHHPYARSKVLHSSHQQAMRPPAAVYELSVLGPPRVQTPKGEMALERKTAAVLAYLAVEGETPKYKLAGMLWPDSGETAARNNMRQLLRRLRMTTGDIIEGDDRISLSQAVSTDVSSLSSLDLGKVIELKTQATLLEGLDYDDAPDYAEWLENVREEFAALRLRAAETEAERLESKGQLSKALELAQLAVKLEPLSEEAYRRVMRLQYLLGARAAALAAFERCKKMLEEELGAGPLEETLELAKLIERGATLKGAAPRPKETSQLPTTILRPPVLAGREREWQLMDEAWEQGKLIFLSGEAGTGKSRLATDFLASKGKFVYESARPGDVHIPYSTHVRLMRGHLKRYSDYDPPLWVRQALSPLFPELGAPPAPNPNTQTQFAEASLEVMRQIGLHGEAMVVDDFHFMDDSTVQIGIYMFSQLMPLRTPGNIQGFVGCFRGAEISPFFKEQVANMVASGMAVQIELESLPGEAIETLLEGLGLQNTEHLVPGLSRYTGGNPLFVLETLKYLIETDTLSLGLPSRLAPPGKVAALVSRRLQRLSPQALNLARVAAVAGTSFDVRLAAHVLERPAMELAEAHHELESTQILRGNAFTHDLVFEAVLAGIPVAVKQILHAETAKYLASLPRANPAVVAQHYLESGDELSAAPHLLHAAHQSFHASLLQEARGQTEKAQEIYQRHGDPRSYEAASHLFEILWLVGSFEDLSGIRSHLLRFARNRQEKIIALSKSAQLLYDWRRFEEALGVVGEALAIGSPQDRTRADLHQIELNSYLALGQFEKAKGALEEYKALAEELDDVEVTAWCLEDEGIFYAALDEHEKAIALFEKVTALAREIERYHFGQARILARRAESELALGFGEKALASTAAAREVLSKYTISARRYTLPWMTQALAHLALGNLAKAWEAVQEAERYDQEEGSSITYPVVAAILRALGQEERAEAELRTFLAGQRSDVLLEVEALLLLYPMTHDKALLEGAERLVAEIPKPELHIKLALAKALSASPGETVALLDEALKTATDRNLQPLIATVLVCKAQALLKLERPDEARETIERALTQQTAWLSPAELYFTAHQIYEALDDPKATAALEKAQTWIDETAKALPQDMRKTFLKQSLHEKILVVAH